MEALFLRVRSSFPAQLMSGIFLINAKFFLITNAKDEHIHLRDNRENRIGDNNALT
jgi:hypothetical protein